MLKPFHFIFGLSNNQCCTVRQKGQDANLYVVCFPSYTITLRHGSGTWRGKLSLLETNALTESWSISSWIICQIGDSLREIGSKHILSISLLVLRYFRIMPLTHEIYMNIKITQSMTEHVVTNFQKQPMDNIAVIHSW